MFKEFTKPTEADWNAQLEKELKGASLDSMDWALDDGTRSRAFHFPQKNSVPPLVRPSADWQICEDIEVQHDAEASNLRALAALQGGVEGLVFTLGNKAKSEVLEVLLKGVFLDYVGLHFRGNALSENPAGWVAALSALVQERTLEGHNIKGSLHWNPEQSNGLSDYRYAADLLNFLQNGLPNLKLATISAKNEAVEAKPTDSLLSLFQGIDRYLTGMQNAGIAPQVAAQSFTAEIEIGRSYFIEIAKLRAAQLLWMHVQEAWDLPRLPLPMMVRFAPAAYSDEIYTNMIRATTMCMSAVIGGASHIVVLPHDVDRTAQNPYGEAFSKRIARNVQHLLKSESYMNSIVDPAAGSFYVEDLTEQMAKKVWRAMRLF